jgi:hypothetical protein
MPVEVAKSKVDKVLQEIARFTPHQLERVIQNASILRVEKLNRVMPSRESEVLEIINRGLGNQKQARIDVLRDKLENENITPREHAQLIKLSEEVEKLAAERLQALMELAAVRKSSVAKLMRELQLDSALDA